MSSSNSGQPISNSGSPDPSSWITPERVANFSFYSKIAVVGCALICPFSVTFVALAAIAATQHAISGKFTPEQLKQKCKDFACTPYGKVLSDIMTIGTAILCIVPTVVVWATVSAVALGVGLIKLNQRNSSKEETPKREKDSEIVVVNKQGSSEMDEKIEGSKLSSEEKNNWRFAVYGLESLAGWGVIKVITHIFITVIYQDPVSVVYTVAYGLLTIGSYYLVKDATYGIEKTILNENVDEMAINIKIVTVAKDALISAFKWLAAAWINYNQAPNNASTGQGGGAPLSSSSSSSSSSNLNTSVVEKEGELSSSNSSSFVPVKKATQDSNPSGKDLKSIPPQSSSSALHSNSSSSYSSGPSVSSSSSSSQSNGQTLSSSSSSSSSSSTNPSVATGASQTSNCAIM